MITNVLNNKQYIGQTSQPLDKRWAGHIRCAASSQHTKMLIARAIRKYGKSNFRIEILTEFTETTPQNIVDKVEVRYIDNYNTCKPNGYNLAKGGKTIRHADTYKKKISKSHKRYWNSLTAEERQTKLDKMRTERNKVGTNWTPEGMERKRQYWVERWSNDEEYRNKTTERLNKMRVSAHTPEAQVKRSKALVLSKNKTYIITAPDGTVTTTQFLTKYCKERGLDPSAINKIIKGKITQHKGYKAKLVGFETPQKEYLPQSNRYLITTPDQISFCRYGLSGIDEEFGVMGLADNLRYRTQPNHHMFGKPFQSWTIELIETKHHATAA